MEMPRTKATKKHASVCVIAGKDSALVDVECDKLIAELLQPHQRATGLFNVNPKEVSAVEVFDELRTLPFLADKRVAVIRGADKFISENRELLEKYFDNPSPTGILVLTVDNWASRTRLARKLPKVGKLITVVPPKFGQLHRRLIDYAADAHSKRLAKEAAQFLNEICGDELPMLYSEVDKLALYAGDSKVITAQHVEKLVGHNRLFNIFTVIDACLEGEPVIAVNRLRSAFEQDRSAEYRVIGGLAFHFRLLFRAKVLLEQGMRSDEIIKRLGIRGNRDAFFRQLRKMSLRQIGEVLQQLADMDYAVKTGRTDAKVAVEQLVLQMARPRK
jgi:DNA polymerase-3 subunit delta